MTHHWENGLNYLYYEVLYGNYPLIHNSEFLSDYGYYYKDFDAEDGGRALLKAMKEHDRSLKDHAARNAPLFARLDPQSADNIRLHEKLMLALCIVRDAAAFRRFPQSPCRRALAYRAVRTHFTGTQQPGPEKEPPCISQ